MYQRVCSLENLFLAYRRASRGKRGKGPAARFEHRLEENLVALSRALREQTYVPGGYCTFVIHEPKRRVISAAPFVDRVVHHALCNVIEPLFEKRFISDSYANRRGKGNHRALDCCQRFSRLYSHVLQCDIRQYFAAIDHEVLLSLMRKGIGDKAVMGLIERILAGGRRALIDDYKMEWFPGDNLLAVQRPRGLPIGNLTSQFWANCYLDPVDHFVKRELGCKAYLRYVDDFLLFSNDPRKLMQWRCRIIERLQRFRLTIHLGAHARPVTEGIPFLGFIVFPNLRRLKRRKGIHFRRRLGAKASAHAQGKISTLEITRSVQGWVNHLRYANTVGLRKAVLRTVVLKPEKRGPQNAG